MAGSCTHTGPAVGCRRRLRRLRDLCSAQSWIMNMTVFDRCDSRLLTCALLVQPPLWGPRWKLGVKPGVHELEIIATKNHYNGVVVILEHDKRSTSHRLIFVFKAFQVARCSVDLTRKAKVILWQMSVLIDFGCLCAKLTVVRFYFNLRCARSVVVKVLSLSWGEMSYNILLGKRRRKDNIKMRIGGLVWFRIVTGVGLLWTGQLNFDSVKGWEFFISDNDILVSQ